MSNTVDAPTATRRQWIRLAVIALASVLCATDLTALNLMVPHLTEGVCDAVGRGNSDSRREQAFRTIRRCSFSSG